MNNKRGQLAIFVIIALVIIAIIIAVLLYPKLPVLTGGDVNPGSFLKSCIEPAIKENMQILGGQGGYAKPEGVLAYKGQEIKYLCYTSEYYKTCTIQQPLLKEHVEKELQTLIRSRAEECFSELKNEYEKRGYEISASGKAESRVEISPGEIEVHFLSPLTIKKESTRSFQSFDIKIESKMYELLMIAVSILDYESTYGDSETTLYTRYYPDLKMEKIKLSDGSKVYILGDAVTQESFKFASRSLSWPAGYGLE